MDKAQFFRALEIIKAHDTIVIHRHKNPDGDALGSQIGLKTLINDNFPEKKVYLTGDEAGRMSFMEGSVMDDVPDSVFPSALSVVLDTSAPALIYDGRYNDAEYSIRFDHHLYIDKICNEEFIDSSYESCAGIIADFAYSTGLRLSPLSASSIYTGMVTDSGRFLYDSTSQRTHSLASFLLCVDFDRNAIFRNLYTESFASLRRRSAFIERIQFTEHNVAYVYNTRKDVEDMGMSAFNVSRGMVNTMANISGVHIWVNFTEDGDSVLSELRSDSADINKIAVKYGGGGHLKASGATLKSREEAMAMLSDLDKLGEMTNE
ncbi:MAG: bifunctional oligoribonuclease/PAP phosphatase NrnA [Candidatus Ornithospirochaeta sp.]